MKTRISLTTTLNIVFLVICFSCANPKRETFTFVQLCDTQLGMGGYEHDILSFELAVKQINELNPDFVVICGDLVNHASDSSFKDFNRIVEGFSIPCYPAPGNHDIGQIPTKSTLNRYREKIGKDYYTFHNKGVSFVIVNTQLWKANVANESKKHDEWFKSTLDSFGSKYTHLFVIGHYPLYIKSSDEKEEYFNLPPAKRKELLSLFKNNKVKAYLSGHKHETVINNIENIQLVSGETTSKNFDKRPLGFRLWKVTEDTVSHQFIPLEYLEELNEFGN